MTQKFYFAYFGSKKRELNLIMPIINEIIEKAILSMFVNVSVEVV